MRITVVPGSPTPIYRQIVDQVRAAVARRDLDRGAALPSVRALADDLTVNMNTVAKAYGELVRHGDVISEPGRGVFVADQPPLMARHEQNRRLAMAVERLVAEAVHLGVDRATLFEAIDKHCKRAGVLGKEKRHA